METSSEEAFLAVIRNAPPKTESPVEAYFSQNGRSRFSGDAPTMRLSPREPLRPISAPRDVFETVPIYTYTREVIRDGHNRGWRVHYDGEVIDVWWWR